MTVTGAEALHVWVLSCSRPCISILPQAICSSNAKTCFMCGRNCRLHEAGATGAVRALHACPREPEKRAGRLQVMVRKDRIDASALCLYRKPEAAQPERPLFIEAPTSDAPDEVRRPAWHGAWCVVATECGE